jgi:hypothetical protein
METVRVADVRNPWRIIFLFLAKSFKASRSLQPTRKKRSSLYLLRFSYPLSVSTFFNIKTDYCTNYQKPAQITYNKILASKRKEKFRVLIRSSQNTHASHGLCIKIDEHLILGISIPICVYN